MKIKLEEIDTTYFTIKAGSFLGIDAVLVNPTLMGVDWNQSNKIFRSSVWDMQGNLLSASFPKFMNWGEKELKFPVPNNLNNCNIVTKIDGSTAIIDYIDDKINVRSRGTFDAKSLENGSEFYEVLNMYPKIELFLKKNSHISLLLEHLSPNNVIVLKHEKMDAKLIGAIDKNDYSLYTQKKLDQLAKELDMERPAYYSFKTVKDLMDNVKEWNNSEGVCVYHKNDQEIHKIKSLWYLKIHVFKSNLTFKNLLDIYLSKGEPSYNDFYQIIVDEIDWECAEMCIPIISQLCEVKKNIERIVNGMREFINVRKNLSRKEIAFDIISSYGKGNSRASTVFTLLDNKEINEDQKKKLYFQCIKD
jgi:hypothetical protein